MKDQAATALQPLREIVPLKPFTDDFFQRSKEISDSIVRRAFEIFESSGRISGRDHEDWKSPKVPSKGPSNVHGICVPRKLKRCLSVIL